MQECCSPAHSTLLVLGHTAKAALCRAHSTSCNADPSSVVLTFFHCTVPAWGTAPHQPQAGDAPTPRASAASSISQAGSLMSHNKAVLATPPWRDGSSALHRTSPVPAGFRILSPEYGDMERALSLHTEPLPQPRDYFYGRAPGMVMWEGHGCASPPAAISAPLHQAAPRAIFLGEEFLLT